MGLLHVHLITFDQHLSMTLSMTEWVRHRLTQTDRVQIPSTYKVFTLSGLFRNSGGA